jgi:hypothetical protein
MMVIRQSDDDGNFALISTLLARSMGVSGQQQQQQRELV